MQDCGLQIAAFAQACHSFTGSINEFSKWIKAKEQELQADQDEFDDLDMLNARLTSVRVCFSHTLFSCIVIQLIFQSC
jgi:hypothetical protein